MFDLLESIAFHAVKLRELADTQDGAERLAVVTTEAELRSLDNTLSAILDSAEDTEEL